ncbi:ribonuclease H-like domain-containing protein [Sinorhizobium meliloti]|nr:ribonuclease H-like domain-containing protein [Sinorhizobium meliloti]
MTYLYLDIETIPAQDAAARERIAATVKPPATMKKAETIEAWERDQKPHAVSEAIAKTGLNGAYGHICCIGFAFGEGKVSSQTAQKVSEEAEIISSFFAVAKAAIGNHFPIIVGHNVSGFDIRFIWQRCIALGIRAPVWLPRDPKPWDSDVFDTMTAWAGGARDTISMDNLCAALGLPGKGEIDGSMIGTLFSEGRHAEIADYCRADVERTRAIHRKMMVAFGEIAA